MRYGWFRVVRRTFSLIGLILLAGIISFLSAQDTVPPADANQQTETDVKADQPAPAATAETPQMEAKPEPKVEASAEKLETETRAAQPEPVDSAGKPPAQAGADQTQKAGTVEAAAAPEKMEIDRGSAALANGQAGKANEAATESAAAKPQTEAKPEQSGAESAVKTDKSGKVAANEPQAEKFDIDRGSPKPAADQAGQESASGSQTGKKEGRRSFWSRLFGSKSEQPVSGEAGADAAANDQIGVVDSRPLTPEEKLAAQEEVRRQAREVEALKKIDQAYQEMGRNEFENAVKHFDDGLSALTLRPHTIETRQKARMSQAECEYRMALNCYRDGKTREARDAIRRCLEFYPQHAGATRLEENIKRDELARAEKESRPVPLKQAPAYQAKQKKIKSELQRGREYMALREYDEAENEFKNVLADEKLNSDASANLKKINETRYNLETDEFKRMKAEMLAQIRDTWTPPVKRVVTGPAGPVQETFTASQAKRRMVDKLNNIIIPQLNFINADINAVLKFLHQQSVDLDTDSAPGAKGVNFFPNLNRPGSSAAKAPAAGATGAEGTDVFEADSAAAAENVGEGRINMTVNNLPLMTVLKHIMDQLKLKMYIEEGGVAIYPADVAYGEIVMRTYKVMLESLPSEGLSGGAAGEEAAGEKLEIGGGGGGGGAEQRDWKQFFIRAGIPFPEGTSVMYIPSQTKLIVNNTAENQDKLEGFLSEVTKPVMQIEIEARFVEIRQDDVFELGLEWLLTDNWELAEKSSGLPPSMRERIQLDKTDFTKGLRNLNVSSGQRGTAVGGNLGNIAALSSILTNPELTVILHALEQKDGVNLLSAPKVTCKSGGGAEIKVVEELIYPTEYQQNAQSTGTGAAGNQSVVTIVTTPSAFETRNLGVILTVNASVAPDNETIELELEPQVVELSYWKNYGYTLPINDGSGRTQPIDLWQPIFHARQIQTKIAIWDGQTVVMGGLITEGQQETEDKIPLLGDIPLLGYLFRSTTKISLKKNLLIFVTAKLVDPAGNRIKKETASAAGVNVTTEQ